MPYPQEFNTLPLSVSSFGLIRKNGLKYVDKTALIYQIASRHGAKVFLARPRRFGKSLLVSTLESLFRDGLELFEGLAIENLWHDKRYKVLKLDFSKAKDFHTFEEFLKNFRVMLNESFYYGNFDFTIPVEKDSLEGFGYFLLSNSDIVLLIDEYDAPLNNHFDNIELFKYVREYLSGFYAKIKSNDESFRFIFMTGILKLNHTNIFSSFNNLTDISLDLQYGTLLGYTEDEIKLYFNNYIIRAAQINNKSEKDILEKMKQTYDGFCFDRKASTHVYSPWSVLNFLEKPGEGFENYWYESGGKPTLIMKKLNDIQCFILKNFNNTLTIHISDLKLSSSTASIDDATLLFYTGYLTIDSVDFDEVLLKYPNNEVKFSFSQFLLNEIANGVPLGKKALSKALSSCDQDGVIGFLNAQLLKLDYTAYPIKDESSFRAFVQIIFDSRNLFPVIEKHNSQGRSDIEIRVGAFLWVFELKFLSDTTIADESKRASKLDRLLEEAMRQVQRNKYGEEQANENLRRLCMVFSEKERRIARWQLDPSTLPQTQRKGIHGIGTSSSFLQNQGAD